MQIRNITFAAVTGNQSLVTGEDEESVSSSSSLMTGDQATSDRLRLRTVAVSPHEEYQLRGGSVRPISNELHAAILSRKGRAEITPKGIIVERKDMGGRNVFWHEDSIVCNDLAARERKIFYVVNPLQPDIVHLLTDEGAYIESLPLKSRPEVLNVEQQAEEMRRQQTFISRATRRLQQIHGADTAERLREMQANSAEMQRVVQTLPAPAAIQRREQSQATGAGRMAADGARRINDLRTFRQSALAMGRAVSLSRPAVPSDPFDPDAEDWQASPVSNRNQSNPTSVEQW